MAQGMTTIRSARDVLTDLAWGLWDLGLLVVGRWRHVR